MPCIVYAMNRFFVSIIQTMQTSRRSAFADEHMCSAVKEAVEAATGLRYERQRLLFDRRGNHGRIGGLVELVDEESLGLYEITSGATLYLGFLCMSVATPASKHAGADIDEVMRRAGL